MRLSSGELLFHTRHFFFSWVFVYISFSRISSALMPLTGSFLTILLASVFFTSSVALASTFVFFTSNVVTSFSVFFKADFFSFRSTFKVSMFVVMDAISTFRKVIDSCFSAIWYAYSLATFSLFLLPFVHGKSDSLFLFIAV